MCDWLMIIIVVIGWPVTSLLTGYYNRRQDVALKRLEHRLEALKSFLPVWFAIQKNGSPFASSAFLPKLENARSNFQLYGYDAEIDLMERFVRACETQNLDNANSALSELVPLVRNRIRKELGFK